MAVVTAAAVAAVTVAVATADKKSSVGVIFHRIKNNPYNRTGYYYAILFTANAKRDTFLDAVFLWNTPFVAALLIVAVAAVNAAFAASLSLAAIAAFTFLTEVLTPDLIALFLSAFVLFTKILFFADLILAKMHTSYLLS